MLTETQAHETTPPNSTTTEKRKSQEPSPTIQHEQLETLMTEGMAIKNVVIAEKGSLFVKFSSR